MRPFWDIWYSDTWRMIFVSKVPSYDREHIYYIQTLGM